MIIAVSGHYPNIVQILSSFYWWPNLPKKKSFIANKQRAFPEETTAVPAIKSIFWIFTICFPFLSNILQDKREAWQVLLFCFAKAVERLRAQWAHSWHLDFSEALNLQRCLEPARKATFKIFISNWTFHFAQLICQRGRERKIKAVRIAEFIFCIFLAAKVTNPPLKYFAK